MTDKHPRVIFDLHAADRLPVHAHQDTANHLMRMKSIFGVNADPIIPASGDVRFEVWLQTQDAVDDFKKQVSAFPGFAGFVV